MMDQSKRVGQKFACDMILAMCLDHKCYELAAVVGELLGQPLCGFYLDGELRHAGVLLGPDQIIDARGIVTSHEFVSKFTRRDIQIVELTRDAFLDHRPLDERVCAILTRLVQLAWPDLPWINSQHAKLEAFLTEITQISEKYGFWLGASLPGSRVMIREDDASSLSYSTRITDDGLGTILDLNYG